MKPIKLCTAPGCDTPDEDVSRCEACGGVRCWQHSNYCHDVGARFCNEPDLCDYKDPK